MKNVIMTQAKENKRMILALLVAAIAIAVLFICASCSGATGIEDAESKTPMELQLDSENNVAEMSEGQLQELDAKHIKELTSEDADESEVSNASQDFSSGRVSSQSSEPSQPTQSTSKPSTNTKEPEQQKRWVEDTERVWVVDSAAWSEQKPIYETRELSVCNVCGADITANPSPHTKAHMLAGEGGGYHSEVKQIQVGSETINHPEVGHWEIKVVGGHWE